MNSTKGLLTSFSRLARQAACAVLAAYFWLATSELAWAKAPKKVVEEVETKSYVMPYLIVIAFVAIGLMAVCRPGSRLDKMDEKIKEKKED